MKNKKKKTKKHDRCTYQYILYRARLINSKKLFGHLIKWMSYKEKTPKRYKAARVP